MDRENNNEKMEFLPGELINVLSLPEGTKRLNFFSRFFLLRGEHVYDPLWRYVKKVDRHIYKGQGASVRIGDYSIGMRGPNRIFTHADFKKNIICIGRQLSIPFSSISEITAAHGMLPWRKVPVFVLMIKVDGCSSYIPVHQCHLDLTVVELADFLSSHMHAPIGIASRPLKLILNAKTGMLIHSKGKTPVKEVRCLLVTRTPEGNTVIKLMKERGVITILESRDPLGWIENWGIVTDHLLSIVTRRIKSKYATS